MATVRATYTFTGLGLLVDENQLIAAGWVIAGLVNADGAGLTAARRSKDASGICS
jgi:hypothetical protein